MTYEYKCDTCGHVWEETDRSVDDKTRPCRKIVGTAIAPVASERFPRSCKGTGHRQISSTSFSLKGSGWEKKGGY